MVAAVAMSTAAGSNGGSGGAARCAAWRTAWASARTASSGLVKRRDGAGVRGGGRVGAQPDASTGRSAPSRRRGDAARRPRPRRAPAAARRSSPPRRSRRPRQDPQRLLVLARRSPQAIMSTGFAVEASGAAPRRGAARVAAASGSTRRPAAAHASAQRIAGPAGVGQDATRSPRGQRLASEQTRDVEHLAHRLGPQHAGVREQRVDGDVATRRAAPRCATTRRAGRPPCGRS